MNMHDLTHDTFLAQAWDPFHKQFMSAETKSYKNTSCFDMNNNDPIKSQFCTWPGCSAENNVSEITIIIS